MDFLRFAGFTPINANRQYTGYESVFAEKPA